MDFYWSKGAPGLYYLWDHPQDRALRRSQVGRVFRLTDGRYHGVFDFQGAKATTTGRTSPASMIANLERAICRQIPTARFTRQGF